jgi:hypothetical protein
LVGFSNYGRIDETSTFYYSPSTSSPVEKFNLNAEVGNIEVQYTTRPTTYRAKVEVHLEISGSSIEGKSWDNFFDVNWQNNSSPITFSIIQNPDGLIDPLSWSIKILTIVVTLRADIVFDINITASKGNVELAIPYAVTVNDVSILSNLGNVSLEFKQCVINGDISAITTRNDIFIRSYDVEFTRDSNWSIITESGDIDLNIEQHKDMGGNVIGTTFLNDGTIILVYRDTNPDVGARFWTRGNVSGEGVGLVVFDGFDRIDEGYVSYDFLTSKNRYDLILEINGTTGSIIPDLFSIPI